MGSFWLFWITGIVALVVVIISVIAISIVAGTVPDKEMRDAILRAQDDETEKMPARPNTAAGDAETSNDSTDTDTR